MKAKIKEIFESIQGEGLLVGEKEVFVRFSGCNLNCAYCDTNHTDGLAELSEEELFDKIKKYDSKTLSLTGGEPLLNALFIKSFLKKYKKHLKKEIYLETNGTLFEELREVIDYVDLVGMDIKIESAAKETNRFEENERFLQECFQKAFLKVVFTSDITNDEIFSVLKMAIKFQAPIILQPKSPIDTSTPFLEIYNKFWECYKNVRMIPQTHTFLKIS